LPDRLVSAERELSSLRNAPGELLPGSDIQHVSGSRSDLLPEASSRH